MSFQRFLSTVLLGSTLGLGALSSGCVTEAPVEVDDVAAAEQTFAPGGDDDDEDPVILIISLNGLPPGILTDSTNQGLMAALADGPLSATTALTDTTDGRILIHYLAKCALPEGRSIISVDSNGTQYSARGHVGLAPGWETGSINKSEQNWVSACLLAHANTYGSTVQIALLGNHTALQEAPPSGYTEQEAGFYGDLFGAGEAYACVGTSSSTTDDHDDTTDDTPDRICGRTDQCRFFVTGTCAIGSEQQVCADGGDDNDVYSRCQTVDPDVRFDEVITVYATQGTFGNPNYCPHSAFETGYPLAKSCSPLVAEVCDADNYCCKVSWDDICVDLAHDHEHVQF